MCLTSPVAEQPPTLSCRLTRTQAFIEPLCLFSTYTRSPAPASGPRKIPMRRAMQGKQVTGPAIAYTLRSLPTSLRQQLPSRRRSEKRLVFFTLSPRPVSCNAGDAESSAMPIGRKLGSSLSSFPSHVPSLQATLPSRLPKL